MIYTRMTESQFAPDEVLVGTELAYGILIGAVFASIIWYVILNSSENENIKQLNL